MNAHMKCTEHLLLALTIRDETILQYIDILQYYYSNTIQYGLKEISIYCTLQYIVIYCNVCCHNVVNAQLLHHKNDWTSRNLDYTLQFLMLLYSYTGYIFFSLLPKPIFPYEMSFTKIQSNIAIWQYIAIHSNTIRNMALTRIVSSLLTILNKHLSIVL